MQMEGNEERIVETVAVVEIDPALSLYKPIQQKWVSSLELLSEAPKELRNNSKILALPHGFLLQVNYCEKNRPPIYQIDFLSSPALQWVALKPPAGPERWPIPLCYRTDPLENLEPLTDIDILSTERKKVGEDKEVFIVPAGFKIVNNNPMSHSYLIYRRMKSLLQQTFKPVLLQRYPEEGNGVNLGLLPLFCFPQGIHLSKQLKGFITFNFVLTVETGQRVYANVLSFKEELGLSAKQKLNLSTNDRVYYQKAICLLSRHRYTDEFADCLKHLYRLSMSNHDLPFHKVLQSFVQNMILPPEIGINGLSYSYGGSNIQFTTSNLPRLSDRALYCLFKFLPTSAIITLFEALLLQKKVIFVSQSKTVLGFAAEAALGLLFPFRWEHVLIPILPNSLRQYLAAPLPLVVGISPTLLDSSIETDTLIVQLDSGTLLNDQDLPPLPQKLQKQLRKRLEIFEIYDESDVHQYLENPQSTYIFKMQEVEHPEFQSHLVRDCFLEFILTLMKNYKKFWKQQKYKEGKESSSIGLTEPQLLNDIFKVHDFLADLGMSKVGSFGCKFTEGTIFTSYIERRNIDPHHPQIAFFDEAIERKKSKKDARIIERISNIRYIVAKHPEPESVKSVYNYDKFPSIVSPRPLTQQEINLSFEQDQVEDTDALEQFLEQEYSVNHLMYEESNSSDVIDQRIQGLLLNNYKKEYQLLKEGQKENKEKDLRESLRGKVGSQNKMKAEKLLFFQKVYQLQLNYIEELLQNWPYKQEIDERVVEMNKREYFKSCLGKSFDPSGDQIIAVYEECYGFKGRNYQILAKGGNKIMFTSDLSPPFTLQNLRASKKKIKFTMQVCIPNFILRNFLNRLIPTHGWYLFDFALDKLHLGITNIWNIQTLILFREKIASNTHPL